MKNLKIKIILSSLLLFAIVAMSFTLLGNSESKEIEPKQEGLHWFQINSGINISPTSSVNPTQVTYLGQSELPPTGPGCNGSNYQCVSGFTSDQVTSSNQLAGPQLPANADNLRN